jgi:hypothetical protein
MQGRDCEGQERTTEVTEQVPSQNVATQGYILIFLSIFHMLVVISKAAIPSMLTPLIPVGFGSSK